MASRQAASREARACCRADARQASDPPNRAMPVCTARRGPARWTRYVPGMDLACTWPDVYARNNGPRAETMCLPRRR